MKRNVLAMLAIVGMVNIGTATSFEIKSGCEKGMFNGIVTNANDKKPVDNVRVRLAMPVQGLANDMPTDNNGCFAFKNVKPQHGMTFVLNVGGWTESRDASIMVSVPPCSKKLLRNPDIVKVVYTRSSKGETVADCVSVLKSIPEISINGTDLIYKGNEVQLITDGTSSKRAVFDMTSLSVSQQNDVTLVGKSLIGIEKVERRVPTHYAAYGIISTIPFELIDEIYLITNESAKCATIVVKTLNSCADGVWTKWSDLAIIQTD